jgi:NAD(P)-dependent dehydrogenase (short-subunit alcohol dehydrogenase family)
MTWTPDDIPDLTGRRAVITGVTGGLGLATAIELARHGAELVVTARDTDKATGAVEQITAAVPEAFIDIVSLDLADLTDVRRAADEVATTYDRIDILVNNAGIMAPPKRTTADGFELQIGTNHLGHFAWTATLWPVLKRSEARIVTVSSLAHTRAHSIDLRSVTSQGSPRRYSRWRSYSESKLANLSFALELDRRAKAAGLAVTSVGAHPGISSTNLTKTGVGMSGNPLSGIAMHQLTRVISQSAEAGAQPLLMAATDPSLTGGEYIGPRSLGGTRGRPAQVSTSASAHNEALATTLWQASESATGVSFDV